MSPSSSWFANGCTSLDEMSSASWVALLVVTGLIVMVLDRRSRETQR